MGATMAWAVVVSVVLMAAFAHAQSQVAMRVLVCGVTPPTNYDVQPWIQALEARGIPYDYIDARRNLRNSESLPLVDSSTGHGKYYGIILANAAMDFMANNGNYRSAFSAGHWEQLAEYRDSGVPGFKVRLISGYTWPSGDGITEVNPTGDEEYAMFDDAWASAADATFSTGGQVSMANIWLTAADGSGYTKGTFTPVATFYNQAGVARGSAAAVVTEAATQLETLHFYFSNSEWVASHAAAASLAVTWLVRGVFVGERRLFLSAQIDDHFLSTPEVRVAALPWWLLWGGGARCGGDDTHVRVDALLVVCDSGTRRCLATLLKSCAPPPLICRRWPTMATTSLRASLPAAASSTRSPSTRTASPCSAATIPIRSCLTHATTSHDSRGYRTRSPTPT